jgi:hypothetical protein
LRVRKGATLKEIYAAVRRQFTAADLAKYAEDDDDSVPFAEVIASCEAIHREEMAKRQNRKTKKTILRLGR